MDKLAVTGDSIVLQPTGFLWQGWDGKLSLTGNNQITSEGKSAILETDVIAAAPQGMGKQYVAPPFATPGTVTNLQLTVIPPTLSLAVKIMGQAVVTATTMGTYTATVVPAMTPQGVPDPLLTKVGQWSIQTTSQSSFKSGVPTPVPPEAPSEASGEGSADDAAGELHWVGFTVEDREGTPLANQNATVAFRSGATQFKTLGDSGSARIDGIRVEEGQDKKVVVRMIFDPKLVPIRAAPTGFVAIQMVDEFAGPMVGRQAVLKLPDGSLLTRTLDAQGRTRFEGVPLGAACELDVLPMQVPLSLVLVDEEGTPLAGHRFTVTDSAGTEVSGTLDEQGRGEVVVSEGDCDVRIEIPAAA